MAFPTSNLSQENILRDVHDADTQTLRTTATAIIAPGLEIDISAADGDNIAISDGVDTLAINNDGSINTVIVNPIQIDISAADGDNVAISDGTDTLAINTDGSINITDNGQSITVDAVNLDIRDLSFSTDKVDVTGSEVSLSVTTLAALESITVENGAGAAAVNIQDGGNSITVDGSLTVTASDLDIRDLTHVSDSIKIGDGTNLVGVTGSNELKVNDASTQTALSNILLELQDDDLSVGTEDGTISGIQRVFVNNRRTQILDSHDRVAQFTYADFGTRNQRVTSVDYNSSTFPGITVRRQFVYTLVGNNYRRDNETWTIV